MQSGRLSLLVFSVSEWHPCSLSSTPVFLPGKSHRQRSPGVTVHGATETGRHSTTGQQQFTQLLQPKRKHP